MGDLTIETDDGEGLDDAREARDSALRDTRVQNLRVTRLQRTAARCCSAASSLNGYHQYTNASVRPRKRARGARRERLAANRFSLRKVLYACLQRTAFELLNFYAKFANLGEELLEEALCSGLSVLNGASSSAFVLHDRTRHRVVAARIGSDGTDLFWGCASLARAPIPSPSAAGTPRPVSSPVPRKCARPPALLSAG